MSIKATVTSQGRITIPVKIRRKLGLEAMRAVLGRARARLVKPARKWLEETRGPVSLPRGKG